MSALGKLVGLLIVLVLAVAGIDQLNAAQAHGESLIWPMAVLAIPLIFFAWLVVRAGSLFIRRWRYEGSEGQKVLVGLLAMVLAGGGLLAYVQATVPSQRPSTQLTAALGPACRGTAVAGAGHADPGGARPNHIVVLDQDGNEHAWTGFPSADWRPMTLDDAEYVACVSAEESRSAIEVCSYVDGPAITRYRVTREVRIVEAVSGAEVDHYTLTGDPRDCRQTEQRDLTELSGEVTWGMLAAECSEWVDPASAAATTTPPAGRTPSARPSAKPSPTPPAEPIELATAIKQGLAEATLTGDGLQRLSIELRSLSSEDLVVVVPAGTWFDPQRASTQSMVATAALEVSLAPDESGTWSIDVACGKMRRDQPGEGDHFSIRAEPAEGDLALLIGNPALADQPFRVQQFAIWTLTNNPSRDGYAALGTQFSVFGTGPSKEEFTAVRTLLEEAGIDPTDYRAFR